MKHHRSVTTSRTPGVSPNPVIPVLERTSWVLDDVVSALGKLSEMKRSGAEMEYSAQKSVTGVEPLIVDLFKETPKLPTGYHWIVEHVSFVGALANPVGSGGVFPVTGLYLCPLGTPDESTTDATSGVNLQARPIAIPLNDPSLAQSTVGVLSYVGLVSRPGFKVTVPNGWFVRAIVVCNPGTAAPGPGLTSGGVASYGRITALARMEKTFIERSESK